MGQQKCIKLEPGAWTKYLGELNVGRETASLFCRKRVRERAHNSNEQSKTSQIKPILEPCPRSLLPGTDELICSGVSIRQVLRNPLFLPRLDDLTTAPLKQG